MNPIVFALRRPVTVMMLALALGLGGTYSIFKMQKDIFPSLNQPVIYVLHGYGGMAGFSPPPPFGGNIRSIVIDLDPDRLRSYNLSPQDVVDALDRGNFMSPSGSVTIKDQQTIVPSNAMVANPQELRNVPLKLGQNVYIRDVGTVADSTDVPTGYALVDGKKSVYLPVVKRADASTLTVVSAMRRNLPRFQAALPDDV